MEVVYKTNERGLTLKKDLARDHILDKRVNGVRVEPPVHESTISEMWEGAITVTGKGKTYTITLNK